MGDGQYSDVTALELLDRARENYEVYHLHMLHGANGTLQSVQDGWKQLMGDNVIYVQRREEVAQIIADLVIQNSVKKEPIVEQQESTPEVSPVVVTKEEDML